MPLSAPSSVRFATSPHSLFFFFNDTATTEIYTLSLHDALPISLLEDKLCLIFKLAPSVCRMTFPILASLLGKVMRSEERFSRNAETDLVCRLLLEKKKKTTSSSSVCGVPRLRSETAVTPIMHDTAPS